MKLAMAVPRHIWERSFVRRRSGPSPISTDDVRFLPWQNLTPGPLCFRWEANQPSLPSKACAPCKTASDTDRDESSAENNHDPRLSGGPRHCICFDHIRPYAVGARRASCHWNGRCATSVSQAVQSSQRVATGEKFNRPFFDRNAQFVRSLTSSGPSSNPCLIVLSTRCLRTRRPRFSRVDCRC